jgi:hypothetical protein
VDAALADGYPVHGTSIPGVAQRTGSTTYYVELSTERGRTEEAARRSSPSIRCREPSTFSSPPSSSRSVARSSSGSRLRRARRSLVASFARWAEHRRPHGRPALGQHVRTTTVSGYLRVWLLTLLRPLRPISYRAHEEHARIDRWLAVVARCATWDGALASEVARAAQLVKGYGDVRRRMVGHFDRVLETVPRLAECEAATGGDFEASRSLAARYRTLVLEGPESEARAAALAAETLARL